MNTVHQSKSLKLRLQKKMKSLIHFCEYMSTKGISVDMTKNPGKYGGRNHHKNENYSAICDVCFRCGFRFHTSHQQKEIFIFLGDKIKT